MRNVNVVVRSLLTLVIAVGLWSCNEKKGDNPGPSPAARNTLPQQNIAMIPVSGGWEAGDGRLFADNGDSEVFNGALKMLISAFINPENLGKVDSSSGVKLRGFVSIEPQTGKVDQSKSGIQIEITDEYVGQKDEDGTVFQSLKLGAQVVSVQFMQNNVARVLLKNGGAEYTMEGNFNENEFKGQLNFKNTNSYSQSEQRRSGNIPFSIRTCQFFQCY